MRALRSYLNVLKFRINHGLGREFASNYPIAAFIEPTLFCNLRCPSCPTGLGLGLRPAVAIDEAFFRRTVDEIGDYLFQLHMLVWGEPLMHKAAPELVAYAKQKQIEVTISTNLSLTLSDEFLERLVRSGLDKLIVSIDGMEEETYQRYRRRGSLGRVRANLQRLRAIRDRLGLRTPRLVWQLLVFKHNEHEIDRAVAEHKQWGADEISIGAAIMPRAPNDEGFEPSTLPQFNMHHPESWVQREARRQLSSAKPCSWLYGALVLNPNGRVSPCSASPFEKHDFGEYAPARGIPAVWNNPQFRRARRLVATPAGKHRQSALDRFAQRLNGMSAGLDGEVPRDGIVCHACPIPHLMDHAHSAVRAASDALWAEWRHATAPGKRFGILLRFLLMGAPNWRSKPWARMTILEGSRA